jgi:hypothetical protein
MCGHHGTPWPVASTAGNGGFATSRYDNQGCRNLSHGNRLQRSMSPEFRQLSIDIIIKCLDWGMGVVGSNPAAPTNEIKGWQDSRRAVLKAGRPAAAPGKKSR